MLTRPYPTNEKFKPFRIYSKKLNENDLELKINNRLLVYPRLILHDGHREFTEYVPKNHTWAVKKCLNLKLWIRSNFDRDVYYWHMRHTNQSYIRKIFDLNFIDHVLSDHKIAGDMDKAERKHFEKLYKKYRPELPAFTGFRPRADYPSFTHPYIIAYRRHWNHDLIPNSRSLFHGLKYSDYIECEKDVFDALLKDF